MWIVFESRDGSSTVLSKEFGVTYHSKYGAIQESRHVFIKEGLHHRCRAKKELAILEVGFGTGLNALLTMLEANKLALKINYTALEPHPVAQDIVGQLNYCEKLNVNNGSCEFQQIHDAAWDAETTINERFSIVKFKKQVENLEFEKKFDIIYYDTFAPNVQPKLWEKEVMEKMFVALRPNGVLVTYCAKGVFKRTLKTIGFNVETLKGPPGKREMVRAIKIT